MNIGFGITINKKKKFIKNIYIPGKLKTVIYKMYIILLN